MPEEIDHIAELQQRLYARDPDTVPKRKFGILRPLKEKVESTWGQKTIDQKPFIRKTKISSYKRLFIFSFFFFLLALSLALFSVYKGAVTLSSKNVELTILGNSFVAGGESLAIAVDLLNKNANDLVDTTLTLSYPKGSIDTPEAEIQRVRKDIGTISAGKTKTEQFDVVLFGEQGTSRVVTATLEYKLSGSNATFVKESTFSVLIQSSPISLVVDAPQSTASNQPFTITIASTFTGDTNLDNSVVRVEYPNGYIFQSAIPEPVSGNNTWSLGSLTKGEQKSISIKGKLAGEQQDEKSFRVYVGARTSDSDARIAASYNSVLHTITIKEPSISGQIILENSPQDVVPTTPGATVRGSVQWRNNASVAIEAPVFTLSINGSTAVQSTIVGEKGYYDPLLQSLVWSTDTDSTIASIAPGQTGEFPFSFSTSEKPTSGNSDIVLALSVQGAVAGGSIVEDTATTIDQKVLRFASRLQFASQALYSIGAIKNTGPFPPTVNKDTTYTIQWIMKPVENALTNAVARATVPEGVVWTNTLFPTTESVSYDDKTRTVTWNVGSIASSATNPNSKSVSFQVKVRPTKVQVDSELVLLSPTNVSAYDTAAATTLELSRPEVTTVLTTDPQYSNGKEKVLP